MTASLSHLFMLVRDMAAARRFWVDLIGLRVLHEEPEGYLRVGGDEGFHIGLEAGDPGPPNHTEVAVRVVDVDALYARLLAAGVDMEGPPAQQPWGARHAWLRDPDGRRMSIYS